MYTSPFKNWDLVSERIETMIALGQIYLHYYYERQLTKTLIMNFCAEFLTKGKFFHNNKGTYILFLFGRGKIHEKRIVCRI